MATRSDASRRSLPGPLGAHPQLDRMEVDGEDDVPAEPRVSSSYVQYELQGMDAVDCSAWA